MEASRVFADGALDGQVALVTGGGTNLGKAAAAELARCGAAVVIAGRREDVLEEAAAEIGDRCSCVVGRHPRPRGAERIVRAALERHGRLDFLLNNAGGQYFVPAEGITDQGLARGAAPERRRHAGDVARRHTSWRCAGRRGHDRQRHRVAAPRHAGDGAHRRRAGRGRGADPRAGGATGPPMACRSIAVAIGRFATESLRKYPAELWRSAAGTVPLQRLGEVEEYGWLVALLASPLGRSVLRLGGDARRRAGQLDRAVAAAGLARDGEVPTEERRPAQTVIARTAATMPSSLAGEVLTVAREPSKL